MAADAGATEAEILLVELAMIPELSGAPVNPYLTLLVKRLDRKVHVTTTNFIDQPHPRVFAAIDYIRHLSGRLPADWPDMATAITFQAEDTPAVAPSVSWQRQTSWPVRLIPDIYYYHAAGYEDFLPQVPDWWARPNRFFWRGSTTGIHYLPAERLDELPRYRFCREVRNTGVDAEVDVGFAGVCQGANPEAELAIEERLAAEALIAPFVTMPDQAGLARYVFDIDGNANSWNFMAKLRLGCCVLKVESCWEQWFADRLTPWRHYVPVSADLSDLTEKMRWCVDRPAEAAAIAHSGRSFALAMDFDAEMLAAAQILFSPSGRTDG